MCHPSYESMSCFSSLPASLLDKKKPCQENEVGDAVFHRLHTLPLPVFTVFFLIFTVGTIYRILC